jgi:hypothetical protein
LFATRLIPEFADDRPPLGLALRSGRRPPLRPNPSDGSYTTSGDTIQLQLFT